MSAKGGKTPQKTPSFEVEGRVIEQDNTMKTKFKQLIEDNALINNRFFTWLNNQTFITRAFIKFMAIYHAFWLVFLIGIHIIK